MPIFYLGGIKIIWNTFTIISSEKKTWLYNKYVNSSKIIMEKQTKDQIGIIALLFNVSKY